MERIIYCGCGKRLHYSSKEIERIMKLLIMEHGQDIPVTVGKRTWLVSRHYIALHGLKEKELPDLGFIEVTEK